MNSPGSFGIVANGAKWYNVVPDNQKIIIDLPSLKAAIPPSDRLLALYGTTATNTLSDAIKSATTHHTRVFDVADGDVMYPLERLKQLRDYDIPSLELYRYKGESLTDAIDRWDVGYADLLLKWPYDVGAVIQSYRMLKDTYTWTEGEVREIAIAGVHAVNRYGPRVKLAAAFAWERLDGVKGVCGEVCTASSSVPDLRPIGPVNKYPLSIVYNKR